MRSTNGVQCECGLTTFTDELTEDVPIRVESVDDVSRKKLIL